MSLIPAVNASSEGQLALLQRSNELKTALRKSMRAKLGWTPLLKIPLIACQGVFGQQFDQIVFENFSKLTTKRAKMTVKE